MKTDKIMSIQVGQYVNWRLRDRIAVAVISFCIGFMIGGMF